MNFNVIYIMNGIRFLTPVKANNEYEARMNFVSTMPFEYQDKINLIYAKKSC